MPASSDARGQLPWPLLGALAFYGFLFLLDFPKPMIDDLFYTGAALNLASGGDFSNPLLARQHFPGHFFFVYPPLHSYALAGWLKVFGISAASLLGFQGTMYFIIAGSVILILRHQVAPALLQWLAPLGVTAVFMSSGLRPEPFAVALTMAGYAWFLCRGRGNAAMLGSFLLMFLGASAAPRTAPFAGAMAMLAAWRLLKPQTAAGCSRTRVSVLVGLALAITVILFLICIGFRLSEFRETFHLHATRVSAGKAHLFVKYFAELGTRIWPLLLLAVGLVIFSIRHPADELSRLGYFLAGAFPLTALLGGLGHGTGWYLVLIFFVAAASVIKNLTPGTTRGVLVLCVSVLIIANSTFLVTVFAILTGGVHADGVENKSEALALRSTAEHPVLVDISVARYVFDYKIPPGFIDWEFAAPFPGTLVTDAPLQAADIFAVGESSVEILNVKTRLDLSITKWVPWGLKKWSLFQNPRKAFIIRAADCLESRTHAPPR